MDSQQENNDKIADLKLAAAVQKALLTGDLPECTCGKMALKCRMSSQVGGDFYHFRQLGPDQIAFAIGDVVGHGIGAALIMATIMTLLRTNQQDSRRPSRLVAGINDMLVRLGDQIDHPLTCSIIYGVVDLPSGVLMYVNAGHPHPFISHRTCSRINRLNPTTMLLGVQHGVLPESCYQFEQQDRLVLFTDGITEARNSLDQIFGEQQLQQTISRMSWEEPGTLADSILDQVKQFNNGSFPQEDDQTLVVIDFDRVSGGF